MPRCQSCGAASGASFTTWSNPATDSVTRPARKSSMARSRISRALGARCWAPDETTRRTTALLTPQIEAKKRVVIPHVEKAVRQCRVRAHDAVENLRAGDRFERLRGGGREDHLSALAKNQQPIADEQHAAGAKLILAPFHRSGLELHGAEARAELLTPVVPVEEAVVVDARRVVIRERVV